MGTNLNHNDKRLVVILGAGFSLDAGLPLGRNIQEKFERDFRGEILRFSSGEWMWAEGRSENEIHNGRIGGDHIAYSYIFNELTKEYIETSHGFIDYEDYYQFLIDNVYDSAFLERIYERAKKALLLVYPKASDFLLFPINHPQPGTLIDIINYLIADLLYPKITPEVYLPKYIPFVEYLKFHEEVDIFSLNHDILLESIFEANGIEFSRGFQTANSNLKYEDTFLPTFQNEFGDAKIRIHKLHGSIDCYAVEHLKLIGFSSYEHIEGLTYYLPGGYYQRHRVVRIDTKTGEVIQEHSGDVVPKFITGKSKMKIIQNDPMYKVLYEKLEDSIMNSDRMLISGYSFGDEHVNNLIYKNSNIEVINHNPFVPFPYGNKAQNISSLNELY